MEEEEVGDEDILHGKRRKLHHDKTVVATSNDILKTPGVDAVRNSSCKECLHHYFPRSEGGNLQYSSKSAVIFDDCKGNVEEMSYKVLHFAANFVKDLIASSTLGAGKFVGVKCNVGRLYPALILGILRSERGFYNISKGNWEDSVVDGVVNFNLKYILSETSWVPGLNEASKFVFTTMEYVIPNCNLNFFVHEIISNKVSYMKCSEDNMDISMYAYAIQTSGTTGRRKTVFVPHSCICPNVEDFIRFSWNVTSDDVIFGAAPPTFDPHVVELFATLGAGATIVYTESKLNGRKMAALLSSQRVSVLQVTPSVFRRIFKNLDQERIPSLRVIAFGGEKCPGKEELREMLGSHSRIRLQNVYGVTEVSCWASVSDIDLESDDEISIGKGILETGVSLKISDENKNVGEILILSPSRYCCIMDQLGTTRISNEGDAKAYYTGDVGRLTPSGIIFEGRNDRVIKRNGMKISLHQIEAMALSTSLLSYSECKVEHGKIYLIVKLKAQYEALRICQDQNKLAFLVPELSTKLDLPLFMYPDAIIAINYIPLNSNGKLDFNYIISSLVSAGGSESSEFIITRSQLLKTLEPIWRSCTWAGVRSKDDLLEENFVQVGGTSISAARFVESSFLSLNLFGSDIHQNHENIVLENLMNGTFRTLLDFFMNLIKTKPSVHASLSNLDLEKLSEFQEPLPYPLLFPTGTTPDFEIFDSISVMDEDQTHVFNPVTREGKNSRERVNIAYPLQLVNMYDFILGLCVDASPTVTQTLGSERIIIGCHGGVLLCVDLSVLRLHPTCSSMAIAWKRRLPNRIEAPIVTNDAGLFGYVGCHDCNFYKFSISNGAMLCFTTCNGPIRSKAALCEKHDIVIFIDSVNTVYCVRSQDLNIVWKRDNFRLLATVSPVIQRNVCYITTLDKGLIKLDIHNGNNIGTNKPCNYQYSSPTVVYGRNKKSVIYTSLFAGTEEGIEARDPKTLNLLWTHKVSTSRHSGLLQPIYNKCCDNVISIIPRGTLKLFEPHTGESKCNYKILYDISVPNVLYCENERESVCLLFYKVHGAPGLAFINLHSGKSSLVQPWFMRDFETFSQPVLHNGYIMFGGRDNKLHIIKCKSTTC